VVALIAVVARFFTGLILTEPLGEPSRNWPRLIPPRRLPADPPRAAVLDARPAHAGVLTHPRSRSAQASPPRRRAAKRRAIFQLIRHVVTELTIGGALAARVAIGAVALVAGPPDDPQRPCSRRPAL
jgi:hypothetical protein